MIHTIKDFSIVNEAEVDFLFLEFPCFLYDPMCVDNLFSGSSAFLNPACTYCLYFQHFLLIAYITLWPQYNFYSLYKEGLKGKEVK